MYNLTIYYNLKQSIYRYGQSINIITEKIRLVFRSILPCPLSSYLGFRFISSSQLHILKTCLKYATYIQTFFDKSESKPKVLCNNHKYPFLNPYIIATWCRRPLIFQTVSHDGSNSESLKYQMVTPSGSKEI